MTLSNSVFALALGLLGTAAAQARTISADFDNLAGPHTGVPLMCVGAGRANEGLRADWQEQLSVVQTEIGFRYLRMHGLLHDDMGVYTESRDGKPVYNFQYVDILYDALLAHHIRPFVELGFMPGALASGPETIFWWRGHVTPPKDEKKWTDLIHALVAHWKDRYGPAEIEQWYYEVWNEPDLHGFYTGTLDQYLQFYRDTAEAIKAEDPRLRVGGPASASPYAYEQAFEAYCGKNHVPVDFVSSHCYGVEQGFLDAHGDTGTRLSANPHAVSDRMRHSRELLSQSAIAGVELHFTEWSSAYTATDPVHDQYIQAPFILEQVRSASSAVNSMSYWTFTDIFEENGPPKTPFHGGFGLINLQGIRKPAFFAYRDLAQLRGRDLKTADEHSWITRADDGSLAVLFWNYTPLVPPGRLNDQTFFQEVHRPADLPAVTLALHHLPPGPCRLEVDRIGYGFHDPFDHYLAMGAPRELSRAQVQELQPAESLKPTETSSATIGSNGDFTRTFAMRTNDVYLVVLKRQ
ncbi:MAG TPA: hypothetical protein VGL42_02530 [Opitutaceae bacterium]|jgi:xylan 1,4-beta-xylosidase